MFNLQERYSRQIRFGPIGEAGQRRLTEASVLIAGCGALGASLAQHMARAGVGRIVLVDRDYVELSNLHRQSLFDEDDVRAALPKAEAAAAKLRRLNSGAVIEAHVADMRGDNIAGFAAGAELILDGTDNAETRLLLCDEAFRRGIPFVYGGATASQGMSAMLVPGQTACLRCLIGEGGEDGPSCDTFGVLSATVEWVAALQTAEAIKWLTGNQEALRGTWLSGDIWNFAIHEAKLPTGFSSCECCGRGVLGAVGAAAAEAAEVSEPVPVLVPVPVSVAYSHEGKAVTQPRSGPIATALCGRDTVQVTLGFPLTLEHEAERLQRLGCGLTTNRYLVKAELPSPRTEKLVLFPDGRILVQGTSDIAEAERLCGLYIGHANMELKETIG